MSRTSFARLFLLSSSALLFFLILLFGIFWGLEEYRDLQSESRRIKKEHLAAGKQHIRREVFEAIRVLEFKHSQVNQRLEEDLRKRVYSAHAIAVRVEKLYANQLPERDLTPLVIEALQPENNRDRFFILNIGDTVRGGDEKVAAEMLNLLPGWNEADDRPAIRNLIRTIRRQGEGLYAYTGVAESGRGGMSRIAFFKYFYPLNWLIGADKAADAVEDELQQEALTLLRNAWHDDKNYIFVIRSDGMLLSHPEEPLVGKNILEHPDFRYRDAVTRLIRNAKSPEGGETRYLWPKPSGGTLVPKLSYTKTFTPWGWIVGSGVYLDDIDREIAAARADYRKSLVDEFVSGALLFTSFILASLFFYRTVSGKMNAELASIAGFFNRAAASHEKINTDQLRFREFATIGTQANRLVGDFLEVQNRLKYRLKLENLIMTISNRIINSTPDRLDDEIDEALAGIGTMTGMGRCYLFQFRDEYTRMDNTHEWCADGVDSHMHRLQGLAVEDFPTVKNRILKGWRAHVPNVAELSPASATEKAEFDTEGIHSLILVPTTVSERVTGFLGLDATKPVPEWSEEFVDLLCIAGEIIAGGLERRQADANLKEIEEIVESTPAVVFRWINEPGWPVEVVTQNVEKVFGYSSEDFLSGQIRYADIIHPDDRWRVNREVRSHSRQPTSAMFSQEYRIIASDGSVKYLDDRTHIRRNEHGEITHFQGVVLDVSELKQLEAKHQELGRQYQQAQKMEAVGRLAGGVAHDFNNLLTVILGYTEILKKKTYADRSTDQGLEQIHEAAQRAKELTGQLLVFSRKQPMEMDVIEIDRALTESGAMLGRLIGEDIRLVFSVASEPLCVRADISLLNQVLMNLAVNARDAMPDGGTLTIETAKAVVDNVSETGKTDLQPGSYAKVSVSDTGVGMDEATRAHIFEPFFTTKDMEKGTGLGLATCYGIIKQHGGHIFCSSVPDRGTTFRIYLPIVDDVPMAETDEEVRSQTPLPVPATVLVIEDDPGVLRLTSQILSEAGYRVLQAGHPKDAASLAENSDRPINLIVSDVVMPDMKGPEICREILKSHPEAKVLYMSGYRKTDAVSDRLPDENFPYIQKPFSAQLLLDQAAQALGQ